MTKNHPSPSLPLNNPRPRGTFYVPHPRVFAPESDKMMTIQSAKDQCDINKILSQYKKTGILTHVNNARPQYTDLPDQSDYQNALHTIMEAESAFAGLPAVVRDYFGNDPARLLAAITDPSQAAQLRDFGILKPLPPSEPAPAPAATTSAPAAS